ncbi:14287_t:CDS:2 [Gigaspora rosea]|nr:14287_t:CDS:2 [Gigaspora rosea]
MSTGLFQIKMLRRKKNPKITEARNGVLNYTNFIKSMHPEESAFPVKKNHLKEYLTYKAEECNVKAKTLKLYMMNIKAHNKALGFGWNYRDLGAVTKEIWNKTASPFNLDTLNSFDINTTDTFPFPTGIDSIIQEMYSRPNTEIDQNILTNNISYHLNSFHTYPFLLPYIDVQNILSNNSNPCESYDSSCFGAHAFLPLSINDLNTVSLPIGIDSYIQQTHSQSSTSLLSCTISKLENKIFDVQKQIFDAQEQISDIQKQLSIINSSILHSDSTNP